ncbi:LiaF domain-containing protein, partial [uncultured Nocardioides sp.]|uniref:LiaF domain-containing protein n=1 Tax=uncultured Nocardioides sp. TaxID=198441 RepID=UPI0025DA601A
EMTVDLSRVEDAEALDGRTITVEGGVGRIEVIVPDDVDVVASGDVDGPGSVEVFGDENGGIDIYGSGSRSAGTDRPSITIDANLGVGEIIISQ